MLFTNHPENIRRTELSFTFAQIGHVFDQVVVLAQAEDPLLNVVQPILGVEYCLHLLLELMMSLGHFPEILLLVVKFLLELLYLLLKFPDLFGVVFF